MMITLGRFLTEARKWKDGDSQTWLDRPPTRAEVDGFKERADDAVQYIQKQFPRGSDERRQAMKRVQQSRAKIRREEDRLTKDPAEAARRLKWRKTIAHNHPDKLGLRLPGT